MSTTSSGDLYQLFSRHAARAPARDAVRDQHGSLTYAELARRAGALAAAIRELCPESGARIGLHLGRTADLVVAVLAVTATGDTYVPLDPAYPSERLGFMTDDSGLSAVISDRELPDRIGVARVLRLDRVDWSLDMPAKPKVEVDPESAAYVIYTSGSTGRPKGVEVRRRSVVAMVDAVCSRHRFDESDVWTLFHSHCFDFSVWEMWGALATGATLVVVPAEVARSPRASAELLVRQRVTILNIVPSVFRYLAAAARQLPDRPTTVRRIIFGGESIDVADIRSWRESVRADCEFINTYGITETTVFVTTRPLLPAELDSTGDEREFATDLGEPLDGWELQVLDDSGAPVGPGMTGEIWVAGDGVAIGYLNEPDITAERFRQMAIPGRTPRVYYRSGDLATRTANDVHCYSGRADDQVKINGFRIELGEVEAALRRVSGIRDLVVVCTRSRVGGRMLVAFYVADADPTPGFAELARATLPAPMVPGRFVRLAALPRNASGKTDRRTLAEHPEPRVGASCHLPPRTR
ncbi:amino acid adenylation domain-containing protein [Sorangium sp. So ce385]|uniref:amino acid adenylation domain-containing protein n=1 Tax=Sorangium sp. So ce385 TaxID=3133308 RepID=UPI003F5C3A99